MRYVALFRGLNVGGNNIIRMEDLKKMFIRMGFSDVRTYIQSGNVIFDSDTEVTEETIRGMLLNEFAIDAQVTLRTKEEIRDIISMEPFSQQELSEFCFDEGIEHNYVMFVDSIDQKVIESVNGYEGPDLLRSGNREIYLLCKGSIRDSKIVSSLARSKPSLTIRNRNTVCKIAEILEM